MMSISIIIKLPGLASLKILSICSFNGHELFPI